MRASMMNWNPMADTREDTYFRRPKILVFLTTPVLLFLIAVTFLIPHQFPFHLLGPIGTFSLFLAKYMPTVLKVVFYALLSAHLIEAWLAVKLCRQKGIHPDTTKWWAAQTFIYGYFSLNYLVQYDPVKFKRA